MRRTTRLWAFACCTHLSSNPLLQTPPCTTTCKQQEESGSNNFKFYYQLRIYDFTILNIY
ncbi:hypothetical protein ES288_D09G056500v1 [Gossypium darwinii]|uniref:Uncharacterized protein n=1 Tax=Gossypium darwinii TaxID=34276 RepID=A0A5D2B9K4_GOSDA|nr:hypothetical protein ES288_D09G056500v1 [Gossypium darwinii]